MQTEKKDGGEKKMAFQFFSGKMSYNNVEYAVYLLNEKEYRVFRKQESNDIVKYIDIAIEAYEKLDYDHCRGFVRYSAVADLFEEV